MHSLGFINFQDHLHAQDSVQHTEGKGKKHNRSPIFTDMINTDRTLLLPNTQTIYNVI